MKTFHIVTIFPESFNSYFNSSILKRAQKNKVIKIKVINPRDFTKDKHKKVDDKPYGGGAGMVFKTEPLLRAINSVLKKRPASKRRGSPEATKIILLSPRGKQFTQKMARDWAKKHRHLILISGHYEGIDERVKKITKAQEISVGPYILTGGELAAMIIVDAVSRHIPGVLGKKESLEEEKGSFPAYTRPEVLEYKNKKYKVPKVLLSGDHKKIEQWRKRFSQ